jgi:hypothetical protein
MPSVDGGADTVQVKQHGVEILSGKTDLDMLAG